MNSPFSPLYKFKVHCVISYVNSPLAHCMNLEVHNIQYLIHMYLEQHSKRATAIVYLCTCVLLKLEVEIIICKNYRESDTQCVSVYLCTSKFKSKIWKNSLESDTHCVLVYLCTFKLTHKIWKNNQESDTHRVPVYLCTFELSSKVWKNSLESDTHRVPVYL